jgi:hypothetical protein
MSLAMFTMAATTRWLTKPPLSRITLTGLPSRANRAWAASRMSARVAGLVASTRRGWRRRQSACRCPRCGPGPALDHGHSGDVKSQGATSVRASGEGDARFQFCAQVFEQLQQFHAARGPRGHPHRAACSPPQVGGSGALGLAVCVFVKAFTHFFAHHATGQALGGDDVGPVAGFFVILLVNGSITWCETSRAVRSSAQRGRV